MQCPTELHRIALAAKAPDFAVAEGNYYFPDTIPSNALATHIHNIWCVAYR